MRSTDTNQIPRQWLEQFEAAALCVQPRFVEHALLEDAENLAAVTAINAELQRLVPAINGPSSVEGVEVESSSPDVPVKVMAKRPNGALYVFAVAMRAGDTHARITCRYHGQAHRLDADAAIVELQNGTFEDAFGPYDVRLYRIR
jgi:hypothetical protein